MKALTTEIRRYRGITRHSAFVGPVTLEGTSLEDSTVSLRLDQLERPLLLYTFNPSCPACINLLPFVESLAMTPRCELDLIGGFTGSDAEAEVFRTSGGANFPMMFAASGSAWDVLGLEDPSTLALLEPPGTVVQIWRGDISLVKRRTVSHAIAAACRTSE